MAFLWRSYGGLICLLLRFILCLSVLSALMPLCQKRASDISRDGCKPPCGCWELNSGSLEGSQCSKPLTHLSSPRCYFSNSYFSAFPRLFLGDSITECCLPCWVSLLVIFKKMLFKFLFLFVYVTYMPLWVYIFAHMKAR